MPALISPTDVEKDGGYKITLTGMVIADGDYYFHVGPLGTYEDPRAYAGSYGSGDVVTVVDGAASFVTPPNDAGTYAITAYDIATPTTGGTVITDLVYHNYNHRSETFAYRNLQVDWLAVGPRDIIEEDPQ